MDNGAKTRMAAVFGNFTESTPSSAAFLVLATLLFTMGVGMITEGTTTPTAAPITEAARMAETAMEPTAPITATAVPPPPGVVKTKASKTEFAVKPKGAPAEPVEEVAADRATAVAPAAGDVDLAEVNKLKTKQDDYRDPSERMVERPSALQYIFGQFPTPIIPW